MVICIQRVRHTIVRPKPWELWSVQGAMYDSYSMGAHSFM